MIDSELEKTVDHPAEVEETDDTAADHPSGLEESDDSAADHASQVMSESGSVGARSAEVRVLQVGNGQITRSMYRQLDEATFERFEPLGRVKDDKRKPKEGVLQLVGRDSKTGALVRYNTQPPDWSASDGPEEFTHWMRHQPGVHQLGYGRGYAVATSKSFAIVWTGRFDRVCNAPKFWHVNDETPEWVRQSYSQQLEGNLEENKETRIRQVLRRIVLAFSYSPPLEAEEETRTEQEFSYSRWLEANHDTRCTVDLVELEQAWRAKAEAELAELLEAQTKYDEFNALPLIVLPD